MTGEKEDARSRQSCRQENERPGCGAASAPAWASTSLGLVHLPERLGETRPRGKTFSPWRLSFSASRAGLRR